MPMTDDRLKKNKLRASFINLDCSTEEKLFTSSSAGV